MKDTGHIQADEPLAAFQFPRVLAWEVTRRCPLKCRHCRAGASLDPSIASRELTTAECRLVIESLVRGGRPPMVIWTGGEPMLRSDICELVSFATSLGVRSVMAPCGAFATVERLKELKVAGVMALSLSLDGPDAESHDAFRGVDGAYKGVTAAMAAAREAGIPFQVNTTVSKLNLDRIDEIRAKAVELGASKHDLFFLVPVGRGSGLSQYALSPEERRGVLDWMAGSPIPAKATCCPEGPTGCLGGRGFAFLSHVGTLQTCGFVEKPCGNVRDFGFDLRATVAAACNPLGATGCCTK